MIQVKKRLLWRKLRASVRDTWLLFRQFQWPLILFLSSIIGGGVAYYYLSILSGNPLTNWYESIYHILGLTLLNPIEDFPSAWFLVVFYFVMPVIGIGILAQGLADFGVLFFNRNERSKEWEMAVASTFSNHIVLVGLGHLGFRVAHHLYSMGQDVVVIEINPKSQLITSIRQLDIPVLVDDGKREGALTAARMDKARAIVLCTQDDSLNLQMALKARAINPKVRVVLRIFDDDFASALENQFGFRALSATGTASPVFAAAASGVDVTRPITVEGEAFSLAFLDVIQNTHLVGQTVGQIEKHYDLSVVLLRRQEGEADFHPAFDLTIHATDTIGVLGGANEISALIQNSKK